MINWNILGRSIDGVTLRSSNHAFGYNCYHRPEDYLQDSPSITDHAFLSLYAVDDFSPVMLSGELLSRLEGFHFDYTNNRIGFFDINMFDDM